VRIDHAELEVLNARARRERAQAIYRLIIVPAANFVTGIFSHAPRTHIAAQGTRGGISPQAR
jgi:hypothetical protein